MAVYRAATLIYRDEIEALAKIATIERYTYNGVKVSGPYLTDDGAGILLIDGCVESGVWHDQLERLASGCHFAYDVDIDNDINGPTYTLYRTSDETFEGEYLKEVVRDNHLALDPSGLGW